MLGLGDRTHVNTADVGRNSRLSSSKSRRWRRVDCVGSRAKMRSDKSQSSVAKSAASLHFFFSQEANYCSWHVLGCMCVQNLVSQNTTTRMRWGS